LEDTDLLWQAFYAKRSRPLSPPYWVADDYVQEDVITAFGLRRKHILRKALFGAPDLNKWIKASPENAYYWIWQDRKGNWHLVIAWKEKNK
jgi:hypothetical protein